MRFNRVVFIILFLMVSYVFAGWMKTYGWPGIFDIGHDILQDDSNYVFVATSKQDDDNSTTGCALLCGKTDLNGNLILLKRILIRDNPGNWISTYGTSVILKNGNYYYIYASYYSGSTT